MSFSKLRIMYTDEDFSAMCTAAQWPQWPPLNGLLSKAAILHQLIQSTEKISSSLHWNLHWNPPSDYLHSNLEFGS